MACVVGMTTDSARRRREREREYPTLRNWTVLRTHLAYDDALHAEQLEARRRGCTSEPGGPHEPGRVWSIYYFEH